MPYVTATVTKIRFVRSNSQKITMIYTTGYLQIFKARLFLFEEALP